MDTFRMRHSSAKECSDPNEAQRIADYYQRIILSIEQQVDAQAGPL